ncbi:unnamed protein product, partial [Didymodactylos carnosus]
KINEKATNYDEYGGSDVDDNDRISTGADGYSGVGG